MLLLFSSLQYLLKYWLITACTTVLGHHSYTNIDGHDPDIMTAIPELPDFQRIKHNQRWIAYYFYQHLYCPLLYCLVSNVYMCCVKILLYSSMFGY